MISQIFSQDMNETIKKIRDEFSSNIILLSQTLTLENARLCILNSISDYFVLPFDRNEFSKTLDRIRENSPEFHEDAQKYVNEITGLIDLHDPSLYSRIDEISNYLYLHFPDPGKKSIELLHSIVENIFEKHEWLDLYISKEDIYPEQGAETCDKRGSRRKYGDEQL